LAGNFLKGRNWLFFWKLPVRKFNVYMPMHIKS